MALASMIPGPVLGFYAVHGALRREVAELASLERGGCRDRLVHRRAELLVRVLRAHHHAEDVVLMPLLRDRRPDLAPQLDELDRQHDALGPLLDALADEPERAVDLRRVLGEHLDAEEAMVVPAWVSSLSAKEHEQFGRDLRRATPLTEAGLMIAWLLDRTPDFARDLGWMHLPATLRAAHRAWWGPRYRSRYVCPARTGARRARTCLDAPAPLVAA